MIAALSGVPGIGIPIRLILSRTGLFVGDFLFFNLCSRYLLRDLVPDAALLGGDIEMFGRDELKTCVFGFIGGDKVFIFFSGRGGSSLAEGFARGLLVRDRPNQIFIFVGNGRYRSGEKTQAHLSV